MPTRDELNRAANTNNPFEEAPLRISEYTAKEVATLQSRLEKQLGPEYISTRPGPGGSRVHYLAADKVINLANEVFGFNGWSTEIRQVQIDFVDESQSTGKISLGLSTIVRVTLKDGTFHEDIGYGQIDNCKGKGAAFMKAKKEAVTDGLKRALRNFGNVVGNCLYDKDFLQKVTKIKPQPAKWDPDKLHRHPSYQGPPLSKASSATERGAEQPIGSRAESEKSKATSADFEDDFEGNLFEGVEFDSGNPDEIVLDATTDMLEQREDDLRQKRPQHHDPRQSAALVQPAPPLRPASLPAPPAPQQQQQKPPQPNTTPQVMRRPMIPNGMQQGEHELEKVLRPQQQAQAAPPHLSAAPPQLQASHQPPAPTNVPVERVGFVTGRAAVLVHTQGEPEVHIPANAPAFNPHTESPSIPRTRGVDHSKSMPLNRGTLAPVPAPTSGGATQPQTEQRPQTRSNFVNPQADMGRRIGMPGPGQSPMLNRGGYKPPAMQKRSLEGLPRAPLADVSNVQMDGGGGSDAGVVNSDTKRPRLES